MNYGVAYSKLDDIIICKNIIKIKVKKTLYFQNCLGVFQGGGCRASAYVGAYKAAVEHGVNFSEVVGTSAGSIIAVFIAAGATTEQIERYITELDFNALISPPQPIHNIKVNNLVSKAAGIFSFKSVKKYYPIYSSLGINNSVMIKDWVDKKLREILDKTQPIKFKDLALEAHVIVSDLKTKRVEIFSKENSPNKDVAEAVQYSCNIPFFFQPIELRYVDGGMLSNLGTFVFSNRRDRFYNKILAFSLESDYEENNNEITSLLDYGRTLVNTILDGNLDLQLNLQKDIHIVRINTGNIKATDFDKMTPDVVELLKSKGKEAVNDFLINEIANVKNNWINPNVLIDSFQTLNRITQLTDKKCDEIVIASNDNKFVYEIFPTIIRWINEKTKITYLYSKCESKDKIEHFEFRNRFLEKIGVSIKKIDSLPFTGYLFDAHNKDNCKAIIINDNDHFHSKFYEGESDYKVISLLLESVKHYIFSTTTKKLVIEKMEPEILFKHLRNVSQYDSIDIKLSIESLNIKELTFITQYVRGYKYRQIAYLYDLYKNYNVPLFESAKLILKDGDNYTLITPPVIELIGDKYYVIEGNTRLLYAYKHGLKELNCIIVKGVIETLPSIGRFGIKEVILSDKEVIGEDRYDKFNYSTFRKIESSVRNPKTCLL